MVGGSALRLKRRRRCGGGPPRAAISLSNSSATLTQTSDTAWTLAKTGSVDTANNSVTWTVTATQGATESGILVVNGFMTVTNSGAAGAPIGNIVVNLQTRLGNKWVTASSDIADATHGDGATTANIDAHASSENLSEFTKNSASGQLLFTDAYDNNVLHLPVGTATRIESIISFGNAGNGAANAANVDINGNGVIDTDEARIRSVPSRLGLNVPVQTAGNGTVTLSDTTADPVTATPQLTKLLKERIAKTPGLPEKIAKRAEAIGKRHAENRAKWAKQAQEHWDQKPMTVPRLALEVWDAIKGEDWVLTTGDLGGWGKKLWNFDRPYCHAGRELGTGTQIGISLGAALANKGTGRLVVDLQPDGDLMFDAGALWIAAKYKIPMLVVMFNNRAYYNDWNHQLVLARTRGTDPNRAHIGMDSTAPIPTSPVWRDRWAGMPKARSKMATI